MYLIFISVCIKEPFSVCSFLYNERLLGMIDKNVLVTDLKADKSILPT